MIQLDWTLIVSGIVFLLTLWALNRLLFRPLFAVLDERRRLTTERKGEAQKSEQYYLQAFEKYSARIKEEKQKGYQLAEAVRKEALEQGRSRMAETRIQAEQFLAAGTAKLQDEVRRAEASLAGDAEEIAESITRRVLENG